MSDLLARLTEYRSEIITSIVETGYMIGNSLLAAILVGLPLGTLLYLARPGGPYERRWLHSVVNAYVNVVRSVPFLLFVVALIPFTRWLVGTSFGTTAASVPLAFVAAALYARFSEQTLLDVPEQTIELARSLGASPWQMVTRFVFSEARSGLVLSLTTVTISIVSYSTIMGVVGGGGVGDFAIRYGYQTYEYDLMYTTIALMIVAVMLIQGAGTLLARVLDKRAR
ncbi:MULTISPECIES: methionine ABC transporter permease [Brachybacterium]|uniref:Methionine ABC transporter ATP-binding protein n=1 Tax=Brachybacterium alimentarium TaxID=47845 RepID=A0A2A3YEK7_9MICO|nr:MULTISPECIES: methionine ABC transporter permease [Brachybacterium]PCC33905.1 methionine ABC transporter ATP-binding protein [Brachybacterium alimentarium]PCC37766.1 methionine ABC transporter ATP-binding protein [Brachybacterium alimentarium]RCS60301.1 ABC transporter permease [Brachybacterium sp. JB7]RCS62652.1 ABC transporter permease [Brachybacterium alimentarium]RCS66812.1 ABC transporter permease [Brachybacterium alimentarium]